jgi:Tfp pilus assembly protein PilF
MSPLVLLGIPSVFVFTLLAIYLFRNLGPRRTLFYFASAVFYGILRKYVLSSLIHDDFGPLFPYLMNSPALKFGIVSAQEVVGWSVAALISWLLADRLLRRFRIEPTPHRIAVVAFFCMAAICIAVETAAIGAEWWIWTIKQPSHAIFGKVPLVGLLDWGFVAFDFLLPFLLFASPSPLGARLISLTLFPLHFFFHPKAGVLPEPVPLSPNDLMHAGIFAYVLLRSMGEKSSPILPDPSKEKLHWVWPIAILIIVLSTSFADCFVAKNPSTALASLPLLFLGAIPLLLPFSESIARRDLAKNVARKSEWLWLYRFGALVLVFIVVYSLRAPFHRRTQQFVDNIGKGVEQWNSGDLNGAELSFREALRVRPDQPSGHTILGQLLLQQQRQVEARKELEEALTLNSTQRDALILLTTIDLREKHWKEALERASFGTRLYPNRPEFLYQLGVAKQNLGKSGQDSSQSIEQAIDIARRGGPQLRRSLASLAQLLGDTSTVKALE